MKQLAAVLAIWTACWGAGQIIRQAQHQTAIRRTSEALQVIPPATIKPPTAHCIMQPDSTDSTNMVCGIVAKR